MGGLARRVSYIKKFREKFSQIPALAVDSGYFLADEQTTHGQSRVDAVARSEWALKAYDQSSVDVANLSARDLRFISRVMEKSEFARRVNTQSLLKRLVSANVEPVSSDTAAPQRFIIREVADRRPSGSQSKPIRVAFVGLAEQSASTPAGFRIADPVEAAKRTVPEAGKLADVVVVLAHLKADKAALIAREVPGIDAIIAGNSQENEQVFTPSIKVAGTHIAFTPFETRMLGELRFYLDKQGKVTTWDRYISLDPTIPDDPAAAQTAHSAATAESEAIKNSKDLMNEWLANARMRTIRRPGSASPAEAPVSDYVSATACATCHAAQYAQWSASAHAHSTDGLIKKPFEFETGCLSCHTSGTSVSIGTAAERTVRAVSWRRP